MAWFKVDDGFWAHPKTFMLSDSAISLWLKAGTWASQMLTDGRVPVGSVGVFRASDSAAAELVESGLWRVDGGHYVFHDWDEYQPSASIEKSKRAKRAEDARRAACVRWHGSDCGGQCEAHALEHAAEHDDVHAERHAETMPRPVPSRPVEPKGSLRAIRLPKSWAPTAEHIERAQAAGVDVMDEAENFRLHADTYERTAKNWNAAFTTWLKRSKPKPRVTEADSWMARTEIPEWKRE